MTVGLLVQAAPALADGAPKPDPPAGHGDRVRLRGEQRAPAGGNPRSGGGRRLLSLIPKQVRIVDGYQYDFEDYVGLKRPSDMVDSDRIVSYDILRQPRRGWTAFIAYDEEYRGPLSGHSDVLRIEVKRRF